MFDIADPRWGSWSLCWPHTLENQSGWEHGRMGSLPCPNMSMSNPYHQWLSPTWYSGWKFDRGRNETLVRQLNAEAENDWMPAASCNSPGYNSSTANHDPGCGGWDGDFATCYYRTAHGSCECLLCFAVLTLASDPCAGCCQTRT